MNPVKKVVQIVLPQIIAQYVNQVSSWKLRMDNRPAYVFHVTKNLDAKLAFTLVNNVLHAWTLIFNVVSNV